MRYVLALPWRKTISKLKMCATKEKGAQGCTVCQSRYDLLCTLSLFLTTIPTCGLCTAPPFALFGVTLGLKHLA